MDMPRIRASPKIWGVKDQKHGHPVVEAARPGAGHLPRLVQVHRIGKAHGHLGVGIDLVRRKRLLVALDQVVDRHVILRSVRREQEIDLRGRGERITRSRPHGVELLTDRRSDALPLALAGFPVEARKGEVVELAAAIVEGFQFKRPSA